jgi:hypothetical protein
MRDRHVPRLCTSCRAPMARQEDSCWRCGAGWAPDSQPSRTPEPVSRVDRHVTAARQDLERWFDEGGSLPSEPTIRLTAAAARN